jgi:DNA-binding NtrC family response regulator
MSGDETVPNRAPPSVPLREISVGVTEGPSHGATVTSVEPIAIGSADGNHLVIADPRVSRYHLQIDRKGDRILVADLGSTNGTRIAGVGFEGASVTVASGAEIRIGRTTLKVADGRTIAAPDVPAIPLGGLRGVSPSMTRIMARIAALSGSDASVLVIGESGTGKELIARALHETGLRARGPFVTVDCGALAPDLVESTLFGHEKGAFTGATRRHLGAFERADRGTLFLDELGELTVAQQVRLLGVLERRRFARVGGEEEVAVDVRIVAATHRDLRNEVNRGAFRLDLYYRIAVVTLEVPPLRERLEDLPILVERLLEEEGHDGPIDAVFPRALLDELARHDWPGNVRELRNVVAATLAIGQPPELRGSSHAARAVAPGESFRAAKDEAVRDFEARYLRDLLERAGGNVREASRIARMHRGYLIELLRRHRLK